MLYSTYRPQTFKEVVGQENNILTLKEQCKTKKFDSAYLFAGHRGTGKTTIARILARTVCCEAPSENGPCNQCKNCRSILEGKTLDCIEMDAASHNSITDIKELEQNRCAMAVVSHVAMILFFKVEVPKSKCSYPFIVIESCYL